MYQRLLHNLVTSSPMQFWTGVATAAFALAFFIVGLTRVVEFNGLGLSNFRRRVLKALHVLGCLLFSSSLFLLGLDVLRRFEKPTGALLIAGLILLFPTHIYAGLLRRVRQLKNS